MLYLRSRAQAQVSLRTPKSPIPNLQSSIPNRQSPIVNPQSSIVNRQSPIVNPQSSIVNRQSPIVNPKSSIVNPQSSIVNRQFKKGSVLVFAVIVLSILFVLLATFLFIAQQSYTASKNSLNSAQTDLAAQTGLNHAMRLLRSAVANYSIMTPDGVFDASQASYLQRNNLLPTEHPLRYFESDNTTGALLFWEGTPAIELPHFSSAFLFKNGSPYARSFQIDASLMDSFFYQTPSTYKKVKELPKIGKQRGDYYVWISDLDAKLYAAPQDWDIDTTNTESALNNTTCQRGILNYLNLYGIVTNISNGINLTNNDIDTIVAVPAGKGFHSLAEFIGQNVPSLSPSPTSDNTAAVIAYNATRSALDYFFTVNKDVPYIETTNLLPIKFTKDHKTAININTATLEVIAAALSQIPSEDNTSLSNNSSRLLNIAQRIVSKRPFLCRMDFEDFLAAQIKGTQDDSQVSSPDSLTLPLDTASIWTTPTDQLCNDPPIAYMLYYAIGKRSGRGGVGMEPELTLSQYLEIPGVPNDCVFFKNAQGYLPNEPTYQKERFRYFFGTDAERKEADDAGALITVKEFNNIINSVTCIYPNDDVVLQLPGTTGLLPATVVTQHGTDDSGKLDTIPQGDDVLDIVAKTISAGANGIAETWVSKHRPSYYSYADDIALVNAFWQKVQFAMDNHAASGTATQEFFDATSIDQGGILGLVWKATIEAGQNGILDTTPQGDDVLVGQTIEAGPDGILETSPQVDDVLVEKTINDLEQEIMRQCRLYYRLPFDAGVAPLTAPSISSTDLPSIFNLINWRCLRSQGNNLLAGFYQMSFDHWTTSSGDCSYGYGPMQCKGDSDENDNYLYSSAKPDSGATRTPNTTGDGDVSWSPQFAFRSRFFGIYVLGQGMIAKNDTDQNPKVLGEKRLEAVYDALKDEILWQRSQLSDKRALGEP